MDVQLQELIDKIKKDGIAGADKEAQKIISAAEEKAAAIVKEAEEKADAILKNAKVETSRMEKASEDAIAQSGRNLIISFRESILKELSGLVQKETEKAYNKDLLKKLIPETVKAWAANTDASDLRVLLSAKDLKALESTFKTSLKSQISKGLELKADASLNAGFRIGAKDGSAFYDFSADEVASLFSAYLNPKTAEIMKKAAAGVAESEAEEKTPAKKSAASKTETAKKAPAKKAAAKSTAKGKK